MGMDFSALLQISISPQHAGDEIEALAKDPPIEVERVYERWEQWPGFAPIDIPIPVWVNNYGEEKRISRPPLPSLEASLSTPQGFYFTFGADAVRIYCPLRWQFFLRDEGWQDVMLRACRVIGERLGATSGIVTSDWSPVIAAFFNGSRFEDALAAGQGKEGEVARLSELYEELPDGTWDSHGYWRFLSPDSGDALEAKRGIVPL
jgi:hypothetical protein